MRNFALLTTFALTLAACAPSATTGGTGSGTTRPQAPATELAALTKVQAAFVAAGFKAEDTTGCVLLDKWNRTGSATVNGYSVVSLIGPKDREATKTTIATVAKAQGWDISNAGGELGPSVGIWTGTKYPSGMESHELATLEGLETSGAFQVHLVSDKDGTAVCVDVRTFAD
ncbi:hypothetical protein [Deinococcus pimensis]|uniref:hypothetical protein n=1 Tax=Deinococcus pimensis TaxID=309888 RepID=UPI000484A2EE|nr:hypothetical protein [Deinococcus pimensis]